MALLLNEIQNFFVNFVSLVLSLFFFLSIPPFLFQKREKKLKKINTICQGDILVTCIGLRKTVTVPKRQHGPASLQPVSFYK